MRIITHQGWGWRKTSINIIVFPTQGLGLLWNFSSSFLAHPSRRPEERDVNEIYGNFIVSVGGDELETKWIRMKNHLKIPLRISFLSHSTIFGHMQCTFWATQAKEEYFQLSDQLDSILLDGKLHYGASVMGNFHRVVRGEKSPQGRRQHNEYES